MSKIEYVQMPPLTRSKRNNSPLVSLPFQGRVSDALLKIDAEYSPIRPQQVLNLSMDNHLIELLRLKNPQRPVSSLFDKKAKTYCYTVAQEMERVTGYCPVFVPETRVVSCLKEGKVPILKNVQLSHSEMHIECMVDFMVRFDVAKELFPSLDDGPSYIPVFVRYTQNNARKRRDEEKVYSTFVKLCLSPFLLFQEVVFLFRYNSDRQSGYPFDHPEYMLETIDDEVVFLLDKINYLRQNHHRLEPCDTVELIPNPKRRGERYLEQLKIAIEKNCPTMFQISKKYLYNDQYPKQITPHTTAMDYGYMGHRAMKLQSLINAHLREEPVWIENTRINGLPAFPGEKVFYIDFEGFPEWLYNDETNIVATNESMLFLIGVAWFEQGEYRYKPFYAETMNALGEIRMLRQVLAFIGDQATLIHWSNTEPVSWQDRMDAHGIVPNDTWDFIDLMDIFKRNGIGVKGAYSHGLKDVGMAMHKHGLINTRWNPGDDGMRYIEKAYEIYNGWKPVNLKEQVVEYNRKDCVSLIEIHRYLASRRV